MFSPFFPLFLDHFKWSAGIVITSNAHLAKGDVVTMVVEGMAVEEEVQGHSARLLSLMVLMQYLKEERAWRSTRALQLPGAMGTE